MLPALVLVGIGHRHRFWIPMPAILLWPIWLVGWIVWLPLKIAGTQWEKTLRAALELGLHMSGTRIDIDSSDGGRIHVRMI
jgi:hypothetical protein